MVTPLCPHCGNPRCGPGIVSCGGGGLKGASLEEGPELTFLPYRPAPGRWRLREWHLFRGLQELPLPCWLCTGPHWLGAYRGRLLPHPR